MYSFVYLSFQLREIRERTNQNVRFAFLHLKPGSHSHDFTGDHRRLDSGGVVAG